MKELTIGEIFSVLKEADELEEKLESILEEGKAPPLLTDVEEAADMICKITTLMRRMKY